MPRSTLTPLERLALQLAQAEGWSVSVEARDGARVTLMRRAGWRTLVLRLAPAAEAELRVLREPMKKMGDVAPPQDVTADVTAGATPAERATLAEGVRARIAPPHCTVCNGKCNGNLRKSEEI